MRTRFMIHSVAIMALLALSTAPVFSEPTPPDRRITWDDPNNPPQNVGGYWMYWAPQSEPPPRAYSNARRIDLGKPEPKQAVIIDVKPDASGGLCIQITAYNTGGESGYSNEACGWFGLAEPINVDISP
jgi:hypothetical protein